MSCAATDLTLGVKESTNASDVCESQQFFQGLSCRHWERVCEIRQILRHLTLVGGNQEVQVSSKVSCRHRLIMEDES